MLEYKLHRKCIIMNLFLQMKCNGKIFPRENTFKFKEKYSFSIEIYGTAYNLNFD